MISIIGAQPVKVYSGCNFFIHLNKFLFFFVSFPSSSKNKFKYITICLTYLSFIQILRIASFAICLKYFPIHWYHFHGYSSYIFYYPGIIALWYFYSSNLNVLSIQNHIKIISKYFLRIFLFLVFYHGLIRPLQISITDNVVKPLIEKKIIDEKYFELEVVKHHVTIFHEFDKKSRLHFSIPFGQAYFFLIFFLWFKPQSLTVAMSIYNLVLIPVYTLAIILFLNGYFILGHLITLNESFYRFIYGLIFLLRIISAKQFKLIFNNLEK